MKSPVMVKSETKLNNTKIKIGVLGGSFDPAHKGHLAISKEAKKRFKLKKVIWAITKKNPFKKESKTSLSHSCLLYTSPSPRDPKTSRMPSSA